MNILPIITTVRTVVGTGEKSLLSDPGSELHLVYRLARPRARRFQLRGLPLMGSERVCPQCNSSFVITRGSDMPSSRSYLKISRAHKKRQ